MQNTVPKDLITGSPSSSEPDPVAMMGQVSLRRMEDHPQWIAVSKLPVILAAQIPLSKFKVSDLLNVEEGQLIQSGWSVSEDIPVRIGKVHIAWSEFEVLEESMAMRLTRLA